MTETTQSAPAIGARLRAQRTALRWSVDEAAAKTGIRADYLTAIERGRTDTLPTVGYVLGYVRTYARALGLDPDACVRDYKRELAGSVKPGTRGVPHFVPTRSLRLPRGSVPALGVLAAVVMLGAWYGVQLDTVAAPAPNAPVVMGVDEVDSSETVSDSVVTLQATAPSWVSIRNARDQLVVNRVFVTGEQWQAERGQAFTVSVRDGGAVELHVGTRTLGPLGKPGTPVADFQLGAVQ